MTDRSSRESNSLPASQLRCIGCGVICEKAAQNFRCSNCGDLFEIAYPLWNSTRLDASALRTLWRQRRTSGLPVDESGVWRFRELLPGFDWKEIITLREGNTPLYEMPSCARIAGLQQLYAKHQGMNPTGSFKDTGMTVAASAARREGFRWVACASTGNTSASMAAYAARGGMRSLVLIPEGKVSWGKLSQALDYGALTCQLKTDFDGCMRLLNELVQRLPVYLLNSVNPYRLEGQKTAAIELMEQFDWQLARSHNCSRGKPGKFLGVGQSVYGNEATRFYFSVTEDFYYSGRWANPLVRMIRENRGKKLITVQAETAASAIRIGNPASWKKAVRVLEATSGAVEEVSEVEIALAKAEIGADGVGCEPASAVTLAGLKKLVKQGFVKPSESVVLILTGHLLKDPEFTLKFHRGDLFAATESEIEADILKPQQRAPIVLDATVDAVIQVLRKVDDRLQT